MAVRRPATLNINRRKRDISADFPRFDGGLNLEESEFRLNPNESPEIVNLWWNDGCLQSRPGQEWAAAPLSASDLSSDPSDGDSAGDSSGNASGDISDSSGNASVGYAASDEDFHRRIFLHIGVKLYILDFDSGVTNQDGLVFLSEKYAGLPPNPGTFFRFGDCLYYKNQGAFLKIAYLSNLDDFSVTDAAQDAYIPIVMKNTNPDTGLGEAYQPANCLSPLKRAAYQAGTVSVSVVRSGDGNSRTFSLFNNNNNNNNNQNPDYASGLSSSDILQEIDAVYIDRSEINGALYQFHITSREIIFNAPPPENSVITFALKLCRFSYRLPVLNPDDIINISVDDMILNPESDYILEEGLVTFREAPQKDSVIEITYREENQTAYDSVMNCPYAAVYGAGNQICVAAGGNPRSPGDVFWSGKTENGPDPSYWPVSHILKSSSDTDRVTGFGKQYNQLLVFRSKSIGKLTDNQNNNNKNISGMNLQYQSVNSRVGCDLPGSVRLAENNLIFCDSKGGVYRIRSASAAYENNIELISGKINGSNPLGGDNRPGLLYDLRIAVSGESNQQPVSAFYDGRRYWLCVNGHAWLWDTSLSENHQNSRNNHVWFYFTNINPVSWFRHDGKFYHLNSSGRVTRLGQYFHDYHNPIRKIYQFPVQNFHDYYLLKDIRDLIIIMRADAPGEISLTYETDWECRSDQTDLKITGWDRLTERDLSYRDLSVPRYAAVFRRDPQCRHVRHFSVRLENNSAGENLSLISARIQARLTVREK